MKKMEINVFLKAISTVKYFFDFKHMFGAGVSFNFQSYLITNHIYIHFNYLQYW